jgi:histidinol-phosphate aminotransferase
VTFCVPDAAAVNHKLLTNGVIVRPIAAYGMPDWLRVTIGSERENSRFLEALEGSL